MTDRELLELAAKAAFDDCRNLTYPMDWVYHNIGEWNPLTDDGDALRLAVKLGFINPGCWPDASRIVLNDCVDWITATRRAIVRAAAEIGKVMQGEAK